MNQQWKNSPRIPAILGLILLSLTGCRYDRAFMNMDSNSGSPFFGLQLAVDSGSRPPGIHRRAEADDRPASSRRRDSAVPDHGKSALKSRAPILLTRGTPAMLSGVERTSESRNLKTNVRYSLQAPATDASRQTKTIDLRLSAF
jgi:hypothetical protein